MNWSSWWDWSVEHHRGFLFLIFLVLGASPAIFAPVAGLKLRRLTKDFQYRVLTNVAFLLLAIGVEKACSLVANIDPPRVIDDRIVYSAWYAWWYWAGQACTWAAVSVTSWSIFFFERNSRTGSEGTTGRTR